MAPLLNEWCGIEKPTGVRRAASRMMRNALDGAAAGQELGDQDDERDD